MENKAWMVRCWIVGCELAGARAPSVDDIARAFAWGTTTARRALNLALDAYKWDIDRVPPNLSYQGRGAHSVRYRATRGALIRTIMGAS